MTISRKTLSGLLLAAFLIMASMASAGVGPPAPNAIWADGTLYRTVATPSILPAFGPKDGLYVFPDLAGQRSVSEAKPGDQDYNGGRWQVYVIAVVDAGAIDHELTSWEEVNMYINSGALEVAQLGPSLVCPMIP